MDNPTFPSPTTLAPDELAIYLALPDSSRAFVDVWQRWPVWRALRAEGLRLTCAEGEHDPRARWTWRGIPVTLAAGPLTATLTGERTTWSAALFGSELRVTSRETEPAR